MQRRSHTVWMIACAMIVAQVASAFRCDACEQACCRWTEGREPAAGQNIENADLRSGTALTSPHGSGCPRCAARQPFCDHGGIEANDTGDASPCRCQWEARHDLAGVPAGRQFLPLDGPDHAFAAMAVSPDLTAVGTSSRAWITAAATIPTRPPRILYGVWRN